MVLAIALGDDSMQSAAAYLAAHDYTIPTLLDRQMEVARAFGIQGIPATLLIDRQGTVVARGHGPLALDSPAVQQYIQYVLGQPRP